MSYFIAIKATTVKWSSLSFYPGLLVLGLSWGVQLVHWCLLERLWRCCVCKLVTSLSPMYKTSLFSLEKRLLFCCPRCPGEYWWVDSRTGRSGQFFPHYLGWFVRLWTLEVSKNLRKLHLLDYTLLDPICCLRPLLDHLWLTLLWIYPRHRLTSSPWKLLMTRKILLPLRAVISGNIEVSPGL